MNASSESLAELEQLLRRINYLMNYLTRQFLAERGLTLPRFWVMLNLSTEAPVTMGELQRKMFLAPATVTSLADSLVEEGLASRERDEDDRRLVRLVLTEKGSKVLNDILRFRYQLLQNAAPDLLTDAKNLNRVLSQIYSGLHNQACEFKGRMRL